MLGISERAGELLEVLLDRAAAGEEECVRMSLAPMGVAMELDSERSGDEVFLYHDKKVLVLDPVTSRAFSEQYLDADGEDFCLLHMSLARRNGRPHI